MYSDGIYKVGYIHTADEIILRLYG